MNYIKIDECDLSNGEGARITLWVSGCCHKCFGCHNQSTWSHSSGNHFSQDVEDKLFTLLKNPFIKGLTLTGGDPLSIDNRYFIFKLIHRVKKELPDKDIWLWTGFLKEDLPNDITKEIDFLIDGKFKKNLVKDNLRYRGSENQRIFKNGINVTEKYGYK